MVRSCWTAYADSEDRRAETAFAMCAALLQPSMLTVHDDSDPRCAAPLPSLGVQLLVLLLSCKGRRWACID